MSSPSPEDLWKLKLEFDVLEECRGDALTFDELMMGFVDEDGDSITTPEEIRMVVETLIFKGQLARTASDMLLTTREGEAFADANWPDESTLDTADDDDE